jgi:excisionase family DNA binding protein
MEDALLTPDQVASRLQVTDQTIYNLLRTGDLRGHRVGRLWRVEPADLQEFLARSANAPAWGERLDAILARIRSHVPPEVQEDELEAATLAAVHEARELMGAHRR